MNLFCLVSRQAMANVLPVLMFEPSNVILFTTPEEHLCAENLEKLFKAKGIKVKRNNGLNAYDYIRFKEAVKNQLESIEGETWLNVTGGTKLMALAAYEAFAEKDKKIIYCDTEHQKIITLFPNYDLSELKANLNIEDYLSSYGYSIVETKKMEHQKDYFELFSFIETTNSMSSFIDMFTKIREELSSENKVQQPKFTVNSKEQLFQFQKNFDKCFIQFSKQKKNPIKIELSDFRSGDWLEFYVFFILKKKENLCPLIGVKIKNQEGVENEIDVMVLKDYRLNIYSCKTGKKDNQFDLYQLETLRNITSGTFGKGIFVTANKHSEKFLNRAKELSIKVIQVHNNMRLN
ncbi:MAG: DUF1887 family protein [Ignavibacteriaceae bacterium]|nr:DUF1887 family protein [Ignavibacteriaceae bacterium]